MQVQVNIGQDVPLKMIPASFKKLQVRRPTSEDFLCDFFCISGHGAIYRVLHDCHARTRLFQESERDALDKEFMDVQPGSDDDEVGGGLAFHCLTYRNPHRSGGLRWTFADLITTRLQFLLGILQHERAVFHFIAVFT